MRPSIWLTPYTPKPIASAHLPILWSLQLGPVADFKGYMDSIFDRLIYFPRQKALDPIGSSAYAIDDAYKVAAVRNTYIHFAPSHTNTPIYDLLR